MSRHRTAVIWSLAIASTIAFVVGLSARQIGRAVSQAVVTPDNPIWGGDQNPPAPAEDAAQSQEPAAGRSGRGNQPPPRPRPYSQVVTSEARTDDGIFKVHRVGETLYYEIPRTELGKDFLWVSQIKRTTIGAGYGGQSAGNRVVRWELAGNRVLLKLISYSIVASDPSNPVSRAVDDANYPAIMRAFNVAAFTDDSATAGAPVIDVTSLFTSEVPELSARQNLGARGFDAARTFVERVNSFPQNVNVEVTQTYTSPLADPTAAGAGRAGRGGRANSETVLMFYSMIKLPEKPMMGRLFDERVGYFSQSMYDYSRPDQRAKQRTFITRYRLEKKDPSAALSEPIKPITYYVDPATPTKWVPYVKMGIEWWQPAFEMAGFKNAIVAREAPTDDPDWSAEDVRYSVIRWLPSTTENAVGPHIHDPRSGEILEADVQFYHNVQNLVKNWYFVQAGPLDPRARTLPLPDDLMGLLIAQVVAHEVGHTLGFQHNMKASSTYTLAQVRDKNWVRENGHTPTLMDYSRFNYVAQPEDGIAPIDLVPKIGPYDKWATMWGYKPIPGATTPDDEKPTLDQWARAQDTTPYLRFSTAGALGSDPGDETEAVGDADAVAATTLGLKNLQRVADMLLSATTTQAGDSYDELTEVYGRLIGQWTTEMNHVTNVVGGVLSQQKHIGQAGVRFTPVEKVKQAEAVQFLLANAFQTPQLMIKPEILQRMQPTGAVNRVRTAQNSVMNSLLSAPRLERLIEQTAAGGAAAYTTVQFLGDLRKGIWSELSTPARPTDTYRRNTQRVYLDTIDNRLNGGAAPNDEIRALLKGELHALDAQIRAALPSVADVATRRHLEDSRDEIATILDPRAMRLRTAAGAPAGRGGGPGSAGFDGPAALDSSRPYDYDHDPFLLPPVGCWPDYVVR